MRTIEMREVPLSDSDRIFPILSGLLNCGGGSLIVGMPSGAGGLEECERRIADEIRPVAPIFVHREKNVHGEVVRFDVPAGREPPYAYGDVIFAIDGDVCRRASMQEVRTWVLESSDGINRWENRVCACGDDMGVVDDLALADAARDVEKTGRLRLFVNDKPQTLLDEFKVMRYGRLLNAGLVLFGRTPSRIAPQTMIRLTHFAGRKSNGRIIATRIFDGPLCSIIRAVVEYVVEQTPRSVDFSSKTGNRVEFPVYPVEAIREAIVNACAHRDYESAFGGVTILMFSDRLEIWNSGSLPVGVRLSDLNSGRGAPSVLVNPTIVNHLYVRNLMEKIGRGSALIHKETKAVGTKVWWSWKTGRGVCLTFRHRLLTEDNKRENSQLVDFVNKGSNLAEMFRFAPETKRLVDIITEQPGLRKPILMSLSGLTRGVLQMQLDKLRRIGVIEYRGSYRTGGYYLRNAQDED